MPTPCRFRLHIGSAQKTPSNVRGEIPHHLIDIVEPQQEFNGVLREAADRAIQDIRSRNRIPIVVEVAFTLYMLTASLR